MKRSIFLRVSLGAFAFTACTMAIAADEYPNRPIELLVPFAVGGGTDAVGRALADAIGRHLPHAVVVVNRTGAAGAIGPQEGAPDKADGHKPTKVTTENGREA